MSLTRTPGKTPVISLRINLGRTLSTSTESIPAPAGEEEGSLKPSRPGHLGGRIIGHWVIEVKDRGGFLKEHRNFKNSLVSSDALPNGDQLLAALLADDHAAGAPGLGLVASAPVSADPSTFCSGAPRGSIKCFACNAEKRPISNRYGNSGHHWVLSGQYTVPTGLTSITAVQTIMPFRINSAASVLAGGDYATLATHHNHDIQLPLTSTPVPGGPLIVTAAQSLSITVTISLS